MYFLVIFFGSFPDVFAEIASGPTILYVDNTATGANDGTTWANAFTDLQTALGVVHADCDIWVAKGTYKPTSTSSRNISFVIPDQVRVYGGFAGNELPSFDLNTRNLALDITILSGNIGSLTDTTDNSYSVIKTLNVSVLTVIDGFTISDGNANGPGPDINNLTLGGGWYNEASGSGMYSNPTVKNCIFRNNYATYDGGGMANYGTSLGEAGAILENCIFEGNEAGFSGGGLYFNGISDNTLAKLTNVAFVGNRSGGSSGFGGGCFINNQSGTNTPLIQNCTFLSNVARYGGGLYLKVIGGTLNAEIKNSVFWQNVAYQWNDVRSGIERDGATFSLENSLLQDSLITTNGNIAGNTDPKFLNVINAYSSPSLKADFRLLPCSPLIDAGTNTGISSKDVFNKARTYNSGTVDIGAFEFQGNSGGTIFFVDDDKGDSGGGTSWSEAFGKIQDAQKALAGGCPTYNKIWVAGGIYFPSDTTRDSSFVFTDGLKIYGGFIGNEDTTAFDLATRDLQNNASILSGDINTKGDSLDNSFHVVRTTNVSSGTIIDGFTIKHGHSTGKPFSDQLDGAGWLNDGSDGGNSAPTIRNCTFSKNYARNGGGIFNNGFQGNASPTIENCSFLGNVVSARGGGIDNYAYQNGVSNPRITNCLFAGNTAFRGSGIRNNGGNGGESDSEIIGCVFSGNYSESDGAGIENSGKSSPLILNCTFSGNYSDGDGAGVYSYGAGYVCEPKIVNCIFWNNTGFNPIDASVYDSDATSTITYSLRQDIDDATNGNIPSIDPKFVNPVDPSSAPTTTGNLRLMICSPMTDVGINDSLPGFYTKDIDTDNRLYNATNLASAIVDLGAYEFQGVVFPTSLAIVEDLSVDSDKIVLEDITANNSIISPAKVLYQAGESIILNKGFEVGSGSVFRAEIEIFTCP